MKVQPIQSIQSNPNFEAKRRFIDIESQEQLTQILRKMDKDTFCKDNGATFESTKTTRIELLDHNHNKKAELVDMRGNFKKLEEGRDMFKESLLTIGKTQVSIDNRTGEIKFWKKPFFSFWSSIMKNIKDTLIEINAMYHHPDYVQKHRLSIEGFTRNGYEKLQKILKK